MANADGWRAYARPTRGVRFPPVGVLCPWQHGHENGVPHSCAPMHAPACYSGETHAIQKYRVRGHKDRPQTIVARARHLAAFRQQVHGDMQQGLSRPHEHRSSRCSQLAHTGRVVSPRVARSCIVTMCARGFAMRSRSARLPMLLGVSVSVSGRPDTTRGVYHAHPLLEGAVNPGEISCVVLSRPRDSSGGITPGMLWASRAGPCEVLTGQGGVHYPNNP